MRNLLLLSWFLISSLLYAQEKEPSEKIDFHLGWAKKYKNESPKKHIWHARKALFLAKKYDQKKEIAKSLGEIGSYFRIQSKFDSSRYYYDLCLAQFKKNGDQTNRAITLMRISSLLERDGNLIESFRLLETADSLYKGKHKIKNKVAIYVAMSNILLKQKEYDKMIFYLKKAEKIVGKDLKSRAGIYNNMVGAYTKLDKFEKAYFYANKSIDIRKKMEDVSGLNSTYHNLAGLIYEEKGITPEVIHLFNNALEGYTSTNNEIGAIQIHNNLGFVYRISKEYNLAKYHLLIAEKLSKELDNQSISFQNKEALSNLYTDLEDWENAYKYHMDLTTIKDSLNSLEKTKIIRDLQTKYDIKEFKRDSELAKVNQLLSEEKATKSRNTSILILSIGVLSILILLFIYFQYRQRKKKELLELKLKAAEKKLEFEKQSRLSELKALQSQMNPHFVFNALNSIQDLILQNDRRNSIDSLGKFSELTRKILEQSKYETISVAKEIEMIQLYANLEKLRFGDDLEFNVINQISKEESEELMLPSMFIQPYIENAFKHGLIHKESNKILTVSFQKEKNQLLCTIDDNGIGRKKAKEINHRRKKGHLNFSTEANTQRIDLLNQYQKNNIRLEVIDKIENKVPNGTCVKIYFDLSHIDKN